MRQNVIAVPPSIMGLVSTAGNPQMDKSKTTTSFHSQVNTNLPTTPNNPIRTTSYSNSNTKYPANYKYVSNSCSKTNNKGN